MVLGTYYNPTVTAIGYIKVLAAGKLIAGFDILKVLSLGASAYYKKRDDVCTWLPSGANMRQS